MTDLISKASRPRWAPQIVVLLDDESRVLGVNRCLAGTNFDFSADAVRRTVHSQLHPDCDGKCRFNDMWNKGWAGLKNRDSVEWELDDPELERRLRLNLSKMPEPGNIERERRRRYRLLTITDITKHRREYESLVEQQQALIRLLVAQGLKSGITGEQSFDETGDTGNRLMASYVKTERSHSRQLILAQEKERKRIAAELHDGIAQSIGAVKYRIEDNVIRLAKRHAGLDTSMFDSTVEEIKNLVEEVRRISSNLSPSILEDFGIQIALEWLCEEFKLQSGDLNVEIEVYADEGETPDFIKIAIFRVVQEALNNIAKHARATTVSVSLMASGGGICLMIKDNGIGFNADEATPRYDSEAGLGLRSIRERIEATGGEFTLLAKARKGVEIRAQWAAEELVVNR